MARTMKLKLAAFGGAMGLIGISLGWSTVDRALETEDCSRPGYVSMAYGICR